MPNGAAQKRQSNPGKGGKKETAQAELIKKAAEKRALANRAAKRAGKKKQIKKA
jgi:hypothetical protein